MAITNRIVTRGMGPSRGVAGRAGLVTQGYGGRFSQVVEVAKKIIRGGTRAARRLPEIAYFVKACLVEVNAIELIYELCGIERKVVDPNLAEPTVRVRLKEGSAVNKPRSEILITAERKVKSRKKD